MLPDKGKFFLMFDSLIRQQFVFWPDELLFPSHSLSPGYTGSFSLSLSLLILFFDISLCLTLTNNSQRLSERWWIPSDLKIRPGVKLLIAHSSLPEPKKICISFGFEGFVWSDLGPNKDRIKVDWISKGLFESLAAFRQILNASLLDKELWNVVNNGAALKRICCWAN